MGDYIRRNQDIDALINPQSALEWELALNHPLSPVYKLFMNMLQESIAADNFLEIMYLRWDQKLFQQYRLNNIHPENYYCLV